MLFWFNAQLPQLIENYKMGSAECLSLNFLSIWLAGDTANLIGSILTHQLPFQIYLGVYFVTIDICLLSQWIYYNKFKSQQQEDYLIIPTTIPQDDLQNKPSLFQHPAQTPVNIHNPPLIIDELTPFSSSASPSKWYTLSPSKESSQKLMAILLFTTTATLLPTSSTDQLTTFDPIILSQQDSALWVGRFFAWTCTSLYLMSRIPQLLKNYRRQSVEGLSASLFIFAVCDSLIEALPYLIGSAGTLTFDFSIFCQFLYYRNRPLNKDSLV
ncbi:uncharacterized protein B0P05DRAFT_160782 [Gilbertella persicaria]|uniref:uncharacterized protein n=1 Tax=Gilbertella persicaria TaxID=101096 RepID=UPI0022212055|nr:uncharacterized protein B0P05DRAFT_160782 [Gilbertella persicaria]KAI8073440.1 hypothetical protein B0P05DRAFT_160782 [Gilbertella persicaria]